MHGTNGRKVSTDVRQEKDDQIITDSPLSIGDTVGIECVQKGNDVRCTATIISGVAVTFRGYDIGHSLLVELYDGTRMAIYTHEHGSRAVAKWFLASETKVYSRKKWDERKAELKSEKRQRMIDRQMKNIERTKDYAFV